METTTEEAGLHRWRKVVVGGGGLLLVSLRVQLCFGCSASYAQKI